MGKFILLFILQSWFIITVLEAQPTFGTSSFISDKKGDFTISESGRSTPLLVSSDDWPGVRRALQNLQSDITRVTAARPELYTGTAEKSREIIIAGTIGKSALIDDLIKEKKIDTGDVKGKWESFLIQVIKKPFPGTEKALVVAGSDKRGTIYGIYEISRQIGVSPWYWWADVSVDQKKALYALDVRYVQGPPSVKYRGIFLNDEAPDLTNWIRAKYGTVTPGTDPPIPPGVANYGHEFYTRLFELLLRLKANYLWPAMWNNAFNEDDTLNPKLADEYGIVMGNSHQEPMLRAQKEWDRRYQRTIGSWNYAKNPDILQNFWREGIKRNKDYESIVTIGLRGANDTPMAPGGPEANKSLLEKIVVVQRNILAEEMNPDVTKIPQLWCLYKEVQGYYEAGMRVPDDVTLLWAEDNWGDVRRLPTAEERKRSGGAGIYYHFDYHGGPRSYQWINTNPISKIWDQMSLAKQYGADRIWIVNAGHFKGYEFPVQFFIDLAWNTEKIRNDNLREYTENWAESQFGTKYAADIAGIITDYTRFNGRRKPELLSPSTYSMTNYREGERVVDDYDRITAEAEDIYNKLPPGKQTSFYELVLFPVKASAIVNELYLAAGKNDLYSRQGRASTNAMADLVRNLFVADTSLMGYFNRTFANGKWNHFMDQTHLGYTSWADPPVNSLRAIRLKEIDVPDSDILGVSVEGTDKVWPAKKDIALLPEFDIFNRQKHYIDVFNKGISEFTFTASSEQPWVIIDKATGPFGKDYRLWVSVDWAKVPTGKNEGTIQIRNGASEVSVRLYAFKPAYPDPETLEGFVEGNGYVSIEPEHFTANKASGPGKWIRVEDYGHTLSGMRAYGPANVSPATPPQSSPCLEYKMYLFDTGDIEVNAVFSPTLNFMPGRGLQYAVSFDDQPPRIISLVPPDYNAQNGNRDWEKSVRDNYRISVSKHVIKDPGYHTLKIWMVDPGPVIEKIIVNIGGLKSSYLGPPESYYKTR